MRTITVGALAVALLQVVPDGAAQGPPRTLVAVFAHGDDETSVGPILARYAREGAQVHLVIVTDGAQGGLNTAIARGPDLARARAEEARCATDALGARPPILLGYPDGKLGDYGTDPALLFRLTARLHEELQRLRPDALITWGPDGAVGHPDHRLVSTLVTQLVRAGAPGVPERVFHAYLPAEGIKVINPARGVPPLLIPQAKYFDVHVPFTPADGAAALRSMGCHRSQYPEEVMRRVAEASPQVWQGVVRLIAMSPAMAGDDLFREAVTRAGRSGVDDVQCQQ